MGADIMVQGIKPKDEKWEAMKAIWDNCEKAEIPIPEEVNEYFNYEEPDERGVIVNIPHHDDEHSRTRTEIHLDELPPDVKIIKAYVSY